MHLTITGTIKAIYLRPGRGEPPILVEEAQAVIGTGLEQDHFSKKNGKRQITLLSQEAWDEACNELGTELDPITRRANLLIDGLNFKESKGKFLRIGSISIQIEGETLPCRIMDDAHEGLKDALQANWRGGVYGKILKGGLIAVGDEVRWTSGL